MDNFTRRRFLATVVAAASAQGCKNASTISRHNVRIAEGTQPVAAPIYVANAKEYFKEEGVDAELVSFPTGKLCLDAVIGRNADFATAAETPIVNASFTNQPVKIVATFQRARENTYLVARKDKGINAPMDLKGKVVAVPIGTNAEYAFSVFLKSQRLQPNDLKLINLNPPEMIGPLTRGDVAAVVAWEPHAGRSLKAIEGNGLRFSFAEVYEETYNLVAGATMVDTDSVVHVLRAINRAVAYIETNPTDAIQIVAQRLGMEKEELSRIWPVYHFGLDLRTSLVGLMTSEGQWALKQHQQEGLPPDMGKLCSATSLRLVKPGAVDLP